MIELRWPMLAVSLASIVVLLVLLWTRQPRRRDDGLLVAHTDRLRTLPRFRALARREQLVAAVATLGALAMLTGAILMSARPARPVVVEPDRNGRDIVLCLDVSGSMDPWNRKVVESFRQLLDGLNGERLGLTMYSGLSISVFPLTDDYAFVRSKLDEAEAAFATEDYDYFIGTEAVEERASQTGDGVMSCLQRFDVDHDDRGRAIVLATDNDPLGEGIFTLSEAAGEARRDEVVVYGIGTPGMKPARATELTDAAEDTGGFMSVVEDTGGVDDVIRGIQEIERDRLRPLPTGVEIDEPVVPFGVAVAGFVVLLSGALLGRRR
ncbi:VWA domain-containing protein [Nocardioides sp. 503]|uniref:vWA domain-containing protein n=1 Tax=Nocardioides sp. 503 TaxID=2508326 RepID=UPI00106F445E|nr:VWA domain-containing protein [Nocardioides sp. 503]